MQCAADAGAGGDRGLDLIPLLVTYPDDTHFTDSVLKYPPGISPPASLSLIQAPPQRVAADVAVLRSTRIVGTGGGVSRFGG